MSTIKVSEERKHLFVIEGDEIKTVTMWGDKVKRPEFSYEVKWQEGGNDIKISFVSLNLKAVKDLVAVLNTILTLSGGGKG